MTVVGFIALALAGGLGAGVRWWVDDRVSFHLGGRWKLGIWLVNITGSFALGMVTALAGRHLLTPVWASIVGTGFLGGYTTFSTAMWDTWTLHRAEGWLMAMLHALTMMAGGVAAASLGFMVVG